METPTGPIGKKLVLCKLDPDKFNKSNSPDTSKSWKSAVNRHRIVTGNCKKESAKCFLDIILIFTVLAINFVFPVFGRNIEGSYVIEKITEVEGKSVS